MVNHRINISAYPGTPSADERRSLAIAGGPLYSKERVLGVLARGNSALWLWTRKCTSDVKRLDMELDDVAGLIRLALARGVFKGSWWCTDKPDGSWAACDSYQVFWRQWMRAAHKEIDFEYYVKFAIAKSGALLLLISCHPSEDR